MVTPASLTQLSLEPCNHVAVKVPPIWRTKIKYWFANIEAQFTLAGITTDQTKAAYVIAALDENVMNEIPISIIEKHDYESLKEYIINVFTESDSKRLKHLLDSDSSNIGVREVYANTIATLSGMQNIKEHIIRYKLMQALPDKVKPIIAALPDDISSNELLRQALAVEPLVDEVNALHKKLCFFHKKYGLKARKCLTPDICNLPVVSKN